MRNDEAENLRGYKGHVLIVEDEADISAYLRILLMRLGYAVTGIASSHDEALQLLQDKIPSLVLMDIGLHGSVDGIQTAEEIRRRVDVPVVFLTGYSDHGTFLRAAATAPYGFVLKPFTSEDVERAITLALQRHAFDRIFTRSHARQSAMFNNIADAILLYGSDGRLRMCNGRAAELSGVDAEELIRRPCDDVEWNAVDDTGALIPDTEFPICEALRERIAVRHRIVGLDNSMTGRRRWISVTAELHPSVVHGEEELLCILSDITHLMDAEREFAPSEEKIRDIEEIEARHSGIVEPDREYALRFDMNGEVLYLNDALRLLMGDPGSGTHEAFGAGANEESRQLARELLSNTLRTPGRTVFQHSIVTPFGRRCVEWECTAHDHTDGLPVVYHAKGRTVSQHKALPERSKTLQYALTLTRDAVALLDPEFRFSFVNPAFAKLLAMGETAILGQTPHILEPGLSPDVIERLMAASLNGGWEGDITYTSPEFGKRNLAVSISPILTDDNNRIGYIMIGRDVTESDQEDIRAFEEEMFAAIGRMAGSIAHEMKSPITAALMKLELLRSDLAVDLHDHQAFESTEKELRRLNDIVRSSLDIAGVGRLNLQPVPLQTILDDLCESMSALFSKQNIRFATNSEHVTVLVDPGRIHTVLRNLVTNAIDATGSGGEIAISAQVNTERGVVEILVEDNGPGVEDPLRCFRSFYTTKRWGTGLGLSTARRIADAHDGTLELYSTGPEGSAFLLTLPLATKSEGTASSKRRVGSLFSSLRSNGGME